ncbi:MAG: hypothetical protein ACREF5_02535 [Candidatus Saccharimonadales bacterium]
MFKLRRLAVVLVSFTITLGLISPVVIYADSNLSQSIAQSYNTTESIQQNMIVGLNKNKSSDVIPLTFNDINDMLGVSISASEAPVTLSGSSSTAQVYVATSGRYDVLVSNQNGAIAVGNYISISSLNGIGMKAEGSESTVLGRAAASFSGTGNVDSTATIEKSGGGTMTVAISIIPVNLSVGNNPSQSSGLGPLPGFLQSAGNTIANKSVSAPRIYISLLVLLVTILLAGSLMYSGVKNSITSIGRNPLAKKVIARGLFQVVITGLIIFIIGLFAVYLLLRL